MKADGRWDGLADEVRPGRPTGCGVERFRAETEWPDQATLVEVTRLISDRTFSASAVARALAKRSDIAPSMGTIRVHRRKECACYRK